MDVLFVLFFVCLGGLFIVSLILPWVNRGDLKSLRQEVQQLRQQLNKLLKDLKGKEGITDTYATTEKTSFISETAEVLTTKQQNLTSEDISPVATQDAQTQPIMQQQKEAPTKTKQKLDFEQQFGARLPVWIGAIALALAGFYLVKYSIQAGLITENVRVILGIIFGISLLIVARYIRQKTNLANGVRIAQALSGAGIADLYVCIFAATNLYHLLPPFIGFMGMAVVTALAVILSLRHGMPIALLGLIGGLITPALIHSNSPNAMLLFLYLYVVMLGLFIIIKKQQWWVLSIPMLIGAFLWTIFWIFFGYVPGDNLWLGLFLIALSATFIISSNKQFELSINENSKQFKLPSALNYLTLGSTAILMGLISFKGGFDNQAWGLFGLLAAGSIFIAYFNQKLYGFVPWILMIVNAVMLLTWHNPPINDFIAITIIFAFLYAGSGYYLMWRAAAPLNWAGLCSATPVLYFLIAYYQLQKISLFTVSFSHAFIWGPIALLLALLSILIVWRLLSLFDENKQLKQHLLTLFVLSTVAFIALGLTILLKQNLFGILFATLILTISWVNTKVDIKALLPIAGILTVILILILSPQLLLFLNLACLSLIGEGVNISSMPIIAAKPLFQLGMPAMLLAYSSWMLRVGQENKLSQYIEIITVILFSLMGYCLIRNAFHVSNNWFPIVSGFIERGVITNMFFLIAIISLIISHKYSRPILTNCGVMLLYLAALRIAYFDLIVFNPLWDHQFVGGIPLLNALILPYGFSVLWIYVADKQLKTFTPQRIIKSLNKFGLILLFIWVTLNVRQFFQGGYLDGNLTSNAEIYTYSVVWLLLGIALLIAGTLKHDKMLRIASLIVIILTVGKVFLYDASALSGLYRVFSFLLLGFILIALSWFYSRFVFLNKNTDTK